MVDETLAVTAAVERRAIMAFMRLESQKGVVSVEDIGRGVFGVQFFPPYGRHQSRPLVVSRILAHMEHLGNRGWVTGCSVQSSHGMYFLGWALTLKGGQDEYAGD